MSDSGRRCEGGSIGAPGVEIRGDRAECPSCGRWIVFHPITGVFKHHLRLPERDPLRLRKDKA